MYLCKACGNKTEFIEHNCIKTDLVLDESTGEIKWSQDDFLSCAEVVCRKCNASSEDGEILSRETLEPVVV